jgi:predicted RNA-binding protein
MTNYWLLGTNQTNFNIAKNREFDIECFHDPYEHQVKRVKQYDGLIYYIWQIGKFGAITEATDTYFFDDKNKIFEPLPNKPDEIYRHRILTKPVLVPKNDELLDARGIIKNLNRIKNKKSWTWYVRNSIKKILEEEFELIKSEMRKSGLYKEVNP